MAEVILTNGVIVVDGTPLASREAVMALDQSVLADIKAAVFDAIPAGVKEDMVKDNEAGAGLIKSISEYLGQFDTLITGIMEKYAEYGGIVLFQALASLETTEKLPSRRYETVQQLGLQFFNNYAGLQKLITGLKGTEDEPAMTSEAITAQNNFAKGTRA